MIHYTQRNKDKHGYRRKQWTHEKHAHGFQSKTVTWNDSEIPLPTDRLNIELHTEQFI